jgi:hypothetical protein
MDDLNAEKPRGFMNYRPVYHGWMPAGKTLDRIYGIDMISDL